MTIEPVYILFKIREGPWGGANQFLAVLSRELAKRNLLLNRPSDRGAILINCNPQRTGLIFRWLLSIAWTLLHSTASGVVLRIDGPIHIVRGSGEHFDRLFSSLASSIADYVVFQSEWSRAQMIVAGFPENLENTIINNATDPNVFLPAEREGRSGSNNCKLKLVTSSWSSNPRKGADTIAWCDKNLRTDLFSFTLIGNVKCNFKNIKVIPPLQRQELAKRLREHDVFFAPSYFESCSNAVIEALQCGLPVLARKGTSNEELVGRGGLFFTHDDEIPSLLSTIAQNYSSFQEAIKTPNLEAVVNAYQRAAHYAVCRAQKRNLGNRLMRIGSVILLLIGEVVSYPVRKLQSTYIRKD